MRFLAALLAMLMPLGIAHAQTGMPDYLKDLDRAYHAGDWTLQCNASRFCQIIGVVKVPSNRVGVRAIVLINRGIAKDAQPSLRFVFVDAAGSLSVPPPAEGWRLYAGGLPKMPPPFRLALGKADPQGAYRASPEVSARVIGALQRWPRSAIRDRGQLVAKMPRGNLARLLRKMDRLQHPKKPRMTPAETSSWLKQYHYVTLRSSAVDLAVPDMVLLSCDTRTYVNQPAGVRVGPKHLLWTADCPEGTKVFLQHEGKEPAKFDVRDDKGKIHPHRYAGFNADQSVLELQLPHKGNDGCGKWLKTGFTGRGFVLIEYRRYERCRAVPNAFWPVMWHPTTWKYADTPPSNGGNAPPASEGVWTP